MTGFVAVSNHGFKDMIRPEETVTESEPLAKCPHCKTGALIRAHRRFFSQFVLSCAGFYPYICKACARRCMRPHWQQTLFLSCLGVVVLAVGADGAFYLRARARKPSIALGAAGIAADFPGGGRARPASLMTPAMTGALQSILVNDDIVELSRAGHGQGSRDQVHSPVAAQLPPGSPVAGQHEAGGRLRRSIGGP